jgi:hypothetical protein
MITQLSSFQQRRLYDLLIGSDPTAGRLGESTSRLLIAARGFGHTLVTRNQAAIIVFTDPI